MQQGTRQTPTNSLLNGEVDLHLFKRIDDNIKQELKKSFSRLKLIYKFDLNANEH